MLFFGTGCTLHLLNASTAHILGRRSRLGGYLALLRDNVGLERLHGPTGLVRRHRFCKGACAYLGRALVAADSILTRLPPTLASTFLCCIKHA